MPKKHGWVGLVWVLSGVAVAAACSGDEQASQGPANATGGGGGEPANQAGESASKAGGSASEAGGGVGGEASVVVGGAASVVVGGAGSAGDASPGGGGGGVDNAGGVGNAGGEVAASAGSGGADDAGGAGGAASGYVPGLCQVADPIEPSVLPACNLDNDDSACIECVKTQSCDEYRECFGTEPATACGRGPDEASLGQFECLVECFADGADTALDPDELLADCAEQCSQCPGEFLNDETSALVEAANDPQTCRAQCFPFD